MSITLEAGRWTGRLAAFALGLAVFALPPPAHAPYAPKRPASAGELSSP